MFSSVSGAESLLPVCRPRNLTFLHCRAWHLTKSATISLSPLFSFLFRICGSISFGVRNGKATVFYWLSSNTFFSPRRIGNGLDIPELLRAKTTLLHHQVTASKIVISLHHQSTMPLKHLPASPSAVLAVFETETTLLKRGVTNTHRQASHITYLSPFRPFNSVLPSSAYGGSVFKNA